MNIKASLVLVSYHCIIRASREISSMCRNNKTLSFMKGPTDNAHTDTYARIDRKKEKKDMVKEMS
jgi:hypothetical protein